MRDSRVPWQVWVAVGLTAVAWWLIEQPGNPHHGDNAVLWTVVPALLLLAGSTIGWLLFTFSAFGSVVLALVDYPPGPEAPAALVGLTIIAVIQLAMVFAPATLDWNRVRLRRQPPVVPTD